jgi:hypothetical protein
MTTPGKVPANIISDWEHARELLELNPADHKPPKPDEIVSDARIRLWQKEARQLDEAEKRLGFVKTPDEPTVEEYYRSGREPR